MYNQEAHTQSIIQPNTKAGAPSLMELDLAENKLTSENFSPNAFQSNRQLEILYLSTNKLTTFPVGLPSSLIQLSLAFNAINTITSRSLSSLNRLEVLDLDRNRLTDDSFESMPKLGSLKRITLNYNRITRIPSGLSPSLLYLTASHNQIRFIRNRFYFVKFYNFYFTVKIGAKEKVT